MSIVSPISTAAPDQSVLLLVTSRERSDEGAGRKGRRNGQIAVCMFKSGTAFGESPFQGQELISPKELKRATEASYGAGNTTLSPTFITPSRSTRA